MCQVPWVELSMHRSAVLSTLKSATVNSAQIGKQASPVQPRPLCSLWPCLWDPEVDPEPLSAPPQALVRIYWWAAGSQAPVPLAVGRPQAYGAEMSLPTSCSKHSSCFWERLSVREFVSLVPLPLKLSPHRLPRVHGSLLKESLSLSHKLHITRFSINIC